MRKALNRERTNVGRTAYVSAVKSILLEAQSASVANKLSEDLILFSQGKSHDELKWIDIQLHAARIFANNNKGNVVFVTSDEVEQNADNVYRARETGNKIVVVPTNLRDKFDTLNSSSNELDRLRTMDQYVKETNAKFEFVYVNENSLTLSEKLIWNKVNRIFQIIGGKPNSVRNVVISETMVRDPESSLECLGLWIPSDGKIIIKRRLLSCEKDFIGTLLHECAHAISGASDSTRIFEMELTRLLGIVGSHAIKESIGT